MFLEKTLFIREDLILTASCLSKILDITNLISGKTYYYLNCPFVILSGLDDKVVIINNNIDCKPNKHNWFR